MICTKFNLNWRVGYGDKDFFLYRNMAFPIVASPDPLGP
jgi:hypothetical protein